jgi:hypothetical protein
MALRDRRLTFIAGILGTAPPLLLDRSAVLLAGHRRGLQRARTAGLLGMAIYAYMAIRRSGSLTQPSCTSLDHRKRVFSALGAGILGLPTPGLR